MPDGRPMLDPNEFPNVLRPHETFWRDHQRWLEGCGYMLPARYRPDWVPSWKGSDIPHIICDDGQGLLYSHLIDAVQISSGKRVTLKKISKSVHPHEADIVRMLSSPELTADPRNHCVPIYDVLQVPDDDDLVLLAMPMLRWCHDPPFDTVGEALEFIQEMFECLQFVHEQHVAHRDCTYLNMMMDPSKLYPDLYHPRVQSMTNDLRDMATFLTRTARPTKYYLIDFGLSVKFDPNDDSPTAIPIVGGDRTVPEYQDESELEAHNPFPADVYNIGNMIRQLFLEDYQGLEFLNSLISDMVHNDPAKRPTMDEVVARFNLTRSKLRFWNVRARLVGRREDIIVKIAKNFRHIYRTAKYIIRRYPAVPTPVP